jgi:lysylphosphatidylglycerol synthetase-like protein (DUF2156 family)
MIRALLDYMGEHVTGDGEWWILGLNSILLIPLIFSVFFYPRQVLISLAVLLLLTIAVLAVSRRVRRRHRHA